MSIESRMRDIEDRLSRAQVDIKRKQEVAASFYSRHKILVLVAATVCASVVGCVALLMHQFIT